MSGRQGELRALTSARGIAAWWVVLFHLRLAIAGLGGAERAILGKGYLAVDFFFLLSGFVIALSWSDRLHEDGPRATLPFLRKRFARVWPLHAAMLAGSVVLAIALSVAGHPDPAFPWTALPQHVLLIQAWGTAETLAWNDPAWSISAEFAAYLLYPAVAVAIDWRRAPPWALVASAVALLAGLAFAMHDQPTLGVDVARFGIVRCLFEFATGTVLYALWRTRIVGAATGWTVVLLAAGALAARVPEPSAVPALLAGLLLALASSRAGGGRLLHYLGRISYATYLSHFLLWKVFKLAFVHHEPIGPGSLFAYLALVLAASALLYHRVERPAQRCLDDKAGRWRRPVSRSPRPPAPPPARR